MAKFSKVSSAKSVPVIVELTRGQKAAATKKANALLAIETARIDAERIANMTGGQKAQATKTRNGLDLSAIAHKAVATRRANALSRAAIGATLGKAKIASVTQTPVTSAPPVSMELVRALIATSDGVNLLRALMH